MLRSVYSLFSRPQTMDIRGLIVGLGNPGARYQNTRHNFGFMAADSLVRACQQQPGCLCSETPSRKAKGELYRLDLPEGRGRWLLLKPMTYMNESGKSVGWACGFYKLPPESVLVLHDELDLPLGRLKLKKGGGNAGHNGLKSIAAHLGSNDFYRLRLGIGKPEQGDTRSYVLHSFNQDENDLATQVLQAAVSGIECFAAQGFVAAQQQVNGFTAVS